MSIKDRIEQHMYALQKGMHYKKALQADCDKYGKNTFVVKVFTTCNNKWEASRIETFLMKILKSQNPLYGYNTGDRKGDSPLAIADRWRTIPLNWSDSRRAYYFIKHGILLPPEYS